MIEPSRRCADRAGADVVGMSCGVRRDRRRRDAPRRSRRGIAMPEKEEHGHISGRGVEQLQRAGSTGHGRGAVGTVRRWSNAPRTVDDVFRRDIMPTRSGRGTEGRRDEDLAESDHVVGHHGRTAHSWLAFYRTTCSIPGAKRQSSRATRSTRITGATGHSVAERRPGPRARAECGSCSIASAQANKLVKS